MMFVLLTAHIQIRHDCTFPNPHTDIKSITVTVCLSVTSVSQVHRYTSMMCLDVFVHFYRRSQTEVFITSVKFLLIQNFEAVLVTEIDMRVQMYIYFALF